MKKLMIAPVFVFMFALLLNTTANAQSPLAPLPAVKETPLPAVEKIQATTLPAQIQPVGIQPVSSPPVAIIKSIMKLDKAADKDKSCKCKDCDCSKQTGSKGNCEADCKCMQKGKCTCAISKKDDEVKGDKVKDDKAASKQEKGCKIEDIKKGEVCDDKEPAHGLDHLADPLTEPAVEEATPALP